MYSRVTEKLARFLTDILLCSMNLVSLCFKLSNFIYEI
jgi:hypothetical protein